MNWNYSEDRTYIYNVHKRYMHYLIEDLMHDDKAIFIIFNIFRELDDEELSEFLAILGEIRAWKRGALA